MPLLAVDGVTLAFGGLNALEEFRLSVFPGELVGLIGPNGAGKTTAFNVITGVYKPDLGLIASNDGGNSFSDITGGSPRPIGSGGGGGGPPKPTVIILRGSKNLRFRYVLR